MEPTPLPMEIRSGTKVSYFQTQALIFPPFPPSLLGACPREPVQQYLLRAIPAHTTVRPRTMLAKV